MKNTTVGWNVKKEERKVGDVWEDEHHKYEKKKDILLKPTKTQKPFKKLENI